MNCECSKRQKEAVKNSFLEKGKKVTMVEMPEGLGIYRKDGVNQLVGVSYSEASVFIEGKKRAERIKFMHSFCPFCGTKITTEEEDPQVKKVS